MLVIAAVEPERATQRADDLRGGVPTTALFEPCQVVHRDAGEHGELLAAKARGATRPAGREPHGIRAGAIT
jgi:hypothetical protein